MNGLAVINSLVFLALSCLHFYWALGGKFYFVEALPKNELGKRVLNPTKFSSAIVGLGLLLFSIFYAVRLGWIQIELPALILSFTGWSIATIFFLRAIGDFKYVGIFKKIRDSDFAKNDNWVYSPLCFMLSLNGVLVEIFWIQTP